MGVVGVRRGYVSIYALFFHEWFFEPTPERNVKKPYKKHATQMGFKVTVGGGEG